MGVLQLAPGSLGTGAYPPDGGNISSADAGLYGEIYLRSSVIDLANGFAYFGTDTVPGQVVRVALGDLRPAADFFTLTPCRALDTRQPVGPQGGPALAAGAQRAVTLAGFCGLPATAVAVAVNLTVVAPAAGDIRLFPRDGPSNTARSTSRPARCAPTTPCCRSPSAAPGRSASATTPPAPPIWSSTSPATSSEVGTELPALSRLGLYQPSDAVARNEALDHSGA